MGKGKHDPRFRLPANLLKAIGRVTVEWSELEYWMMVAVVDLADVEDPYGRILATHMSNTAQVDAILACAKERHRKPEKGESEYSVLTDEQYDELLKLIAEVGRLRPKRNEIVHSLWLGGREKKGHPTYRATARREFKVIAGTKTAAEVDALADEILAVSGELFMFNLGRGAELAM